ncbi:MAG: hypothetical protein CVT98_02545 [Bacteroidetes bacterium HGW-Bacteroidetes-15]|nr:MAG: hypothetical protein CVT98_02545 [Bacteroidetes bacterium HGW-Bacteroidetes-15]
MRITKITLAFITLGLVSLFSCVEEEEIIVPNVYVNFNISLDLPQFVALNSVNNSVKVPDEGYDDNGVIIYRFTLDEFLAFDATCPQHITISTSINLDDNGAAGTATCPHCQTTYSFFNFGQASSGYPLKRYKVKQSGSFLNVTN